MRKPVTMTIAALLTALAGWAYAQQQDNVPGPKSLRGTDVAAVDAAPEGHAYVGKKPGLQKPIARTFKDQPPLIPHAVDNFDEITLEENQCLSCHGPEKYKEKRAPKIGDSHFYDREGKKLDHVSQLRYACVACHVAQTDAPSLVDNTFKGELGPKAKAKAKK